LRIAGNSVYSDQGQLAQQLSGAPSLVPDRSHRIAGALALRPARFEAQVVLLISFPAISHRLTVLLELLLRRVLSAATVPWLYCSPVWVSVAEG
jgi:hypothetical protein